MNPQHKNSTLDMFPLTLDALTLRLDRFFFNGTDVFTVGGGGEVYVFGHELSLNIKIYKIWP